LLFVVLLAKTWPGRQKAGTLAGRQAGSRGPWQRRAGRHMQACPPRTLWKHSRGQPVELPALRPVAAGRRLHAGLIPAPAGHGGAGVCR
jgi:hypothetical protein